MMSQSSSRFQAASTAEALAIALEHNPLNANLAANLGSVTPLLAAAFSLANGISRAAPDLVHKPSLHVLVIGAEELAIDQGRWLQLAADLLEREQPIQISLARTEGSQSRISPYAEIINHQTPATIVDGDACILLNAPDIIHAPLMRMPASLADLPGLSWVGKAMSKGIRVSGSASNPMEGCILAACIAGGRLGSVRRIGANYNFDTGVEFEIVPPDSAIMEPVIARDAISWVTEARAAERISREALHAYVQDPAAAAVLKRVAAFAGDLGDLVVGA